MSGVRVRPRRLREWTLFVMIEPLICSTPCVKTILFANTPAFQNIRRGPSHDLGPRLRTVIEGTLYKPSYECVQDSSL